MSEIFLDNVPSNVMEDVLNVFAGTEEAASSLGLSVGYTQVPWTDVATVVDIASPDTLYRLSKTSSQVGDIPEGFVDNNDLSFTNESGETKDLVGRIIVFAESLGNITHQVAAATDNSDSDEEIITDAGVFRVNYFNTNFMKVWYVDYQVSLLDTKSVFPMIQNDDGSNDFELFTAIHKFEVV